LANIIGPAPPTVKSRPRRVQHRPHRLTTRRGAGGRNAKLKYDLAAPAAQCDRTARRRLSAMRSANRLPPRPSGQKRTQKRIDEVQVGIYWQAASKTRRDFRL